MTDDVTDGTGRNVQAPDMSSYDNEFDGSYELDNELDGMNHYQLKKQREKNLKWQNIGKSKKSVHWEVCSSEQITSKSESEFVILSSNM